jgi:ABC-2 type transport system permease protein
MLLIGRCEKEAVTGVLILLCWCIAFGILNKVTYKNLRIKYDGVGI